MRLVVISPFLDRRHGTERVVSELVEQPLLVLRVGLRAHDTAPELMAGIAIASRNGGLIVDVIFQMPLAYGSRLACAGTCV